ncbi:MAG: nickel-dependent hydrogenase large subunit, partial [Patescibacteria group bacterium]
MHQVDLSLTKEITKVEGSATLDVKITKGKVERCTFGISEYKRFYTQAMRGKAYRALPALLARICGTCSNAHLLCSIEACEKALGIKPTPQSMLMKKLTMYALNIRDHALHLYLFVMPDLYDKDSFLELDENDPEQHQVLHDAFAIKAAGNQLAKIFAGRSVHGVNPTIGGFFKVPTEAEIKDIIKKMEEVRPAALRTVERFTKYPHSFDHHTHFMALVANPFSFLEGTIISDDGHKIEEADYRSHLEHVIIPYSQASGYKYQGKSYMVGSLARINLAKDSLQDRTKQDLKDALKRFPSTNIYDNNLAQAIEILHCIDHTIDILSNNKFVKEPPVPPARKSGTGVGVVEAPRGTLYHKVAINPDGKVKEGEIIVPTGQNQINIEQDMAKIVEAMIPDNPSEESLQMEL